MGQVGMRGQNKYVPCLAQLVTDLIRVANIAHNLGASKKKIKWRVLEHTHVNKQKILLYQPTTVDKVRAPYRMHMAKKSSIRLFLVYSGKTKTAQKIQGF